LVFDEIYVGEINRTQIFERGIIIGAWLFEHSEAKNGYPKSTIHDIIGKYCETGSGTFHPHSGRPPLLTDRNK